MRATLHDWMTPERESVPAVLRGRELGLEPSEPA